jgi:urease accessory protein
MLRATVIVRKPAVKPDRVTDTAWLAYGERLMNGFIKSHGGLEIELDLGPAPALNDGDAIKLEDGRLVQVRAAPERLLEIRAENPLRLIRLAWHLGQEHEPAEFKPDAIYVGSDRALAELARRQGCSVMEVTRPFHPERANEHACEHHDHGHGDHRHRDHHEHHHVHDHDHAEHGHGPPCNHGHGPEHEH